MRKSLMILAVMAIAVMGLNGNVFSMGQAPKTLQIIGRVAEVNLKALTVKITPAKGDSVVLQINEKTKLTKGGKSIILPNLKKDDRVTATYQTSWGKKIALSIAAQEQIIAPKKTTPTKSRR